MKKCKKCIRIILKKASRPVHFASVSIKVFSKLDFYSYLFRNTEI